MRLFALATISIALFVSPVFANEQITVNFSYEGNHRVDFSNIPRGPLRIGEFSDSRDTGNPNLIASIDGNVNADQPLAEIVRNALIQGFLKGNANLVDSGENLTIAGDIQSSEAQIVDNNGTSTIQLTIRTNIKLQGSGRTLWESVLFGRGEASTEEGIETALYNALDRTIRSLVQDDYFLIEIK